MDVDQIAETSLPRRSSRNIEVGGKATDDDNPWSEDGCIAYFDLTEVAGNGYCPTCHNLSLSDHGPVPEHPRFMSHDSVLYSHSLRHWQIARYRDDDPDLSAIHLFDNPSCQYCLMLSECVRRLTSCWSDNTLTDMVTAGIRLNRMGTLSVTVSTDVTGSFMIYSGVVEQFEDEQQVQLSGAKTPPNRKFRSPRVFKDLGMNRADLPLFCGKQSLDFLRECMDRCEKEHDICNEEVAAFLPSRLLHLGSSDGDLRLVETQEFRDKDRKYIALSHCWGSGQPFRLTTGNIDQLKGNVPLDRLTPVFRDAIALTRSLGVEYLWIDALNIVQDDSRDWEGETADMASVFESAWLVVVAVRSPDGSVPFLGPSATYDRDFVRFRVNDHEGLPAYVDASKCAHDLRFPEGPTSDRAWCLQETQLPRRAINFTETGASYDCLHGRVQERTPLHYMQTMGRPDMQHDLATSWDNVVSQYSERKLTHPRDRLPAISGLARRFHDAWKSHEIPARIYVAGMWLNCPEEISQLTWCCPRRSLRREGTFHSGRRSLAQYVAPTWSWASVPRQVGWHLDAASVEFAELCPDARVVRWSCKPTAANPYGEVEWDSHLVLRGHVLDALVSFSHPTYRIIQVGGRELSKDLPLMSDWPLAVRSRTGESAGGDDEVVAVRSELDVDTSQSWPGSVMILYMWHTSVMFCGLVLGRPREPVVEDSFERLGIVCLSELKEEWEDCFRDADIRELVVV